MDTGVVGVFNVVRRVVVDTYGWMVIEIDGRGDCEKIVA